ncbi:MAG: helix-turn-helix transcriptional regulator [Pseudomonadota bacterium]
MTEIHQLLVTLKRQLKGQGLTYSDVAAALGISEPSMKRLFTNGRFTLERLAEVSKLLDMTLAELLQEADSSEPKLHHLDVTQEVELVSDSKLLLVAACVLNHWTLADIVDAYRLREAECIKRLLRLDRLRLIDLLPNNRVRLRVARDFHWLPNGPIRRFFKEQGQPDFLASDFNGPRESLTFVHGMLTDSAAVQWQTHLRRLRQTFAELHEESLSAPLAQRRGTGVLLATREWEPQVFALLRRTR